MTVLQLTRNWLRNPKIDKDLRQLPEFNYKQSNKLQQGLRESFIGRVKENHGSEDSEGPQCNGEARRERARKGDCGKNLTFDCLCIQLEERLFLRRGTDGIRKTNGNL